MQFNVTLCKRIYKNKGIVKIKITQYPLRDVGYQIILEIGKFWGFERDEAPLR